MTGYSSIADVESESDCREEPVLGKLCLRLTFINWFRHLPCIRFLVRVASLSHSSYTLIKQDACL